MTARSLVMDLGAPAHQPPAATGTEALGYAVPGGLPELRTAFEYRVRKRSGLDLKATVTAGAALAFTSVVAALTAPGDRVLIPDPGFPAYRSTVEALGRVAEYYSLADVGTRALTDRVAGARLIVLNSPSNPTGKVLSQQSLARVATAARAHDVLVLSDEVYADLVESDYVSMAREAPERTVVLDSVSKSFALAGARVGCAAGPAELIDQVTRTHWCLGLSVGTPSQRLALAALDAGPQYLAGMRKELADKLRLCARILRTHGIEVDEPEAGLFLWLDVAELGSGRTVSELLRRAAGVTVSPGTPFGPSGVGRIRLSCAGKAADVAEGAERIGRTLAYLARRTVTEGKR